ncbi:pyridoxal phosphate-dependent aminotransferase [Cohnella fermenti]|uniref:Aminotransferase n=1 Tax=Cohnella fermenti TaxID=2565925 RepID=A0A4S4C9Y4_9BACL|nr:pyridoxal phosphate-dependent aminotransferase [Cohnella fermenti]THF84567.1 pyridoxal phosphate-dependent aminotransferase [Cohnella fermenti]
MKIDENWLKLKSPDFSAYDGMDPEKKLMLVGADPFFPDRCIPEHIIEATKKALDEGKTHYALDNSYAVPELKRVLVKKLKEFNGLDVDPENELIVVPSSAFGLFVGIRVCIRPHHGDEVLNIDPGFAENFNDVYQMGAISVSVPTYMEDGFQLRIEELEKRVTPHTRCLVLTHPNNPTTTVYKREVLERLADFLKKHDLMVVVDQSFERNIYEGNEYITFAALPGMRERTISVFGTSKDLGLTGFRVAYMVAPKPVIDILKVATFNYVGPTNTFAQYGVAAAYTDPSYVDEWMTIFAERRRFGYEQLNAIPGVEVLLPEGGFFFWVNVSRLGTSVGIRDYLAKDANVGVSPGTWFGENGEGFLRIMYGTMRDTGKYKEAILRIKDSLSKLPVKA